MGLERPPDHERLVRIVEIFVVLHESFDDAERSSGRESFRGRGELHPHLGVRLTDRKIGEPRGESTLCAPAIPDEPHDPAPHVCLGMGKPFVGEFLREPSEKIQRPKRLERILPRSLINEIHELRRHDLVSPPPQLEQGPAANETVFVGEKGDQLLGRTFAEVPFVIDRIAPAGLEPINATARLVPIIDRPDVAEAAVIPVGEVDRPIGTHPRVDGAEPSVG